MRNPVSIVSLISRLLRSGHGSGRTISVHRFAATFGPQIRSSRRQTLRGCCTVLGRHEQQYSLGSLPEREEFWIGQKNVRRIWIIRAGSQVVIASIPQE